MLAPGKNPIKFTLRNKFKDKLNNQEVHWGFGGLSEFTFYRTYSRKKIDGTLETWQDCVVRVIEGMFSILKTHSVSSYITWDENKAHKIAEEAAQRLFEFKWMPPGRGLWMMGTDFIWDQGGAALNNCAFVSTEDIDAELSKSFAFLMDMSMVGVGVGFDTKGAGKVAAYIPEGDAEVITVTDDRAGWVELISCLIDSYLEEGSTPVEYNTSLVRKYGEEIKGFGGVASGPEPLEQGFEGIRDILTKRAISSNPLLTSVDITDIMNIIGKIVVAGNVRRTAEIAFGDPKDTEFRNMKDWSIAGVETGAICPYELKAINLEDYNKYNEDFDSRTAIAKKYANEIWAYKFGGWRWASNNSIFADVGQDYTEIAKSIAVSGEPGLAWLDNMRAFSRMKDPKDWKDLRVKGGNPSLRKGTKVFTSNGIKNIEELQDSNFYVNNLDNKKAKATCFLSGTDKQLYEITLTGGKKYYATPEHEWPVKKHITDKNFNKYSTKSLVKGMWLPVNKNTELGYGTLGDYNDGFIIGWNLGDGWITNRLDNNKTQYGFIISENDKQAGIADKLTSCLQGYGWKGTLENKEEISTTRASIHELFVKFGITHKSSGLSKVIWEKSSESFRKGLIDALISSDGSVATNDKRIEFYSSHIKFIEDVRELLGFYGIKTSVSKRVRNQSIFGRKPKEYTSYTLRIDEIGNIRHFNNCFKLSHKYKQTKIDNLCKFPITRPNLSSHIKIESVVLTDIKEDVWDITVYDDTHCFQLSNCVTGNCLEQSLESYELCCLVETFPAKHETYWEFQRTLKFAYLYAKTVTLMATHWQETNDVIKRNRRIGASQSGIQEAILKFGRRKYLDEYCDKAYNYIRYLDEKYSEWLGVPFSKKSTSVKPSGTVSLVAGALPGIHYAESEAHYRLVRVSSISPLIPILRDANYRIEPAISDPVRTSVIYFPVILPKGTIAKSTVSIWEQFANAVDLQEYWADNQVSITITFKKDEEDQIARALSCYDYKLKGVSLLPLSEHGYEQAPYTPASREEILEYTNTLLPLDFSTLTTEGDNADANKFCDGDSCLI